MTLQYIDASTLNQGNIGDPTQNNRYIRYAIDFDTGPVVFNFPAGAQQLTVFGVPKCMFIDNQSNAYQLSVSVSATGQTFPVPAQSAGYYYIDAVIGSNISISSSGDTTGPITFIFYNFDRSPVVWYKTSVTASAVTVADGADVAQGATTDAAVTNPALNGTIVGILKGILSGINTGTGGTGNIVKQPTAANLNATIVVSDGGDATQGAKADAAVTNPASAGSVIAFLKGILTACQASTPAGTNFIGQVGNLAPGSAIRGDSGNVANAAGVATLAGAVGKTTYITGFAVTGSGATAANVVTVTVAGLLGGSKTYTFVFPAGVTTAAQPLIVEFSNPIPASAQNTAITVTCPASGAGGTNLTVTSEGFQL